MTDMKRLLDEVNLRVEDAREAMTVRARQLQSTLDSLHRAIEHDRALNHLGEIQGEGSKLDACIGRYSEAVKMAELVTQAAVSEALDTTVSKDTAERFMAFIDRAKTIDERIGYKPTVVDAESAMDFLLRQAYEVGAYRGAR